MVSAGVRREVLVYDSDKERCARPGEAGHCHDRRGLRPGFEIRLRMQRPVCSELQWGDRSIAISTACWTSTRTVAPLHRADPTAGSRGETTVAAMP